MILSGFPITTHVPVIDVSSDAFLSGAFIPKKYTCDGKNVNPSLTIAHFPKETKSFALIVDDPDAPVRAWSHWLVWNIKPTSEIKENSVPGIVGLNDFGENRYGGPCPPGGIHHYHFKIYALDSYLDLKPETTKYQLEKAMNAHIIAFGELVGRYERVV